MAAEQSTIIVYALNGANRRFNVPFEYLARKFVQVTLIGATRVPLVLGSNYRFISMTEIETTTAYGGVDQYDTIEIRRVTSATERLVEFSDGSVLRSRDMNVSAIQTIHIAEEARNLASDTLASDDDGNLDARGRKLANLGAASLRSDAVNYGQVLDWSGSAKKQADRSEREATASAGSAVASLASQRAAKTSELNSQEEQKAATAAMLAAREEQKAATASATKSKASESAAREEQKAATASATKSKASESAARAEQKAATASATKSKASETLANKWAENPIDVAVTAGKFSAKHWADKAEQNAGGTAYLRKDDNLGSLLNKEASMANLGLGEPAMRWPKAGEVSGLGTAATRNVGLSVGDVLEVGSYGMGEVANNTNTGRSGFFRYAENSLPESLPLGSYEYGSIIRSDHGYAGSCSEIVIAHQPTPAILVRGAKTFPWVTLYHTGNLLNIGTTAATARTALGLGAVAYSGAEYTMSVAQPAPSATIKSVLPEGYVMVGVSNLATGKYVTTTALHARKLTI